VHTTRKLLQRIGRLEDQFRHAIAQLKPLIQNWYSVPEGRDYARPCPTRVESGLGPVDSFLFSKSLSRYRLIVLEEFQGPNPSLAVEVGSWLKFSPNILHLCQAPSSKATEYRHKDIEID
jgi:hypothetical protein